MHTDVPAVVADLSAEWLDSALRESGVLDVDIGALDVEPLGAAAGLLGDLARVRPTYRRGVGPASLVVKLPATAPGARQVGMTLRAWAREVAFYDEVAPATANLDVPRCFHTGANDSAERWVVVLEDIPADAVDYLAGASLHQAEAAIDSLATFHAAWWESDRRFSWMPGFDGAGVGGLQGLWLESHPHFIERYGHLAPGPTTDWLTVFAPRLAEWSEKAAAEPLTIVHADYRLDNLLFRGDRVTMIDWQTALRGPAAMDVSCFIATSLGIENRREWEPTLLSRYLDALSDNGVTVDPVWFADSYDENLLWWMGQFANNLAHLRPDDPAIQDGLNAMVERTFTAALDRDVGRLL